MSQEKTSVVNTIDKKVWVHATPPQKPLTKPQKKNLQNTIDLALMTGKISSGFTLSSGDNGDVKDLPIFYDVMDEAEYEREDAKVTIPLDRNLSASSTINDVYDEMLKQRQLIEWRGFGYILSESMRQIIDQDGGPNGPLAKYAEETIAGMCKKHNTTRAKAIELIMVLYEQSLIMGPRNSDCLAQSAWILQHFEKLQQAK